MGKIKKMKSVLFENIICTKDVYFDVYYEILSKKSKYFFIVFSFLGAAIIPLIEILRVGKDALTIGGAICFFVIFFILQKGMFRNLKKNTCKKVKQEWSQLPSGVVNLGYKNGKFVKVFDKKFSQENFLEEAFSISKIETINGKTAIFCNDLKNRNFLFFVATKNVTKELRNFLDKVKSEQE